MLLLIECYVTVHVEQLTDIIILTSIVLGQSRGLLTVHLLLPTLIIMLPESSAVSVIIKGSYHSKNY